MADAFPDTRWTRIVAARDRPDLRREVLRELCATRWQPLYVHLRKQGLAPDRAQDVVQGFLVHLLERDFLARLDPGRGRLRAYLKTALGHYLANLHEQESAQKRGGGAEALAFDDVEAIVPSAPDDPDAAFDREWALGLFESAFAELEAELASGARRGPAAVVRQLFRLGEAPLVRDAGCRARDDRAAAQVVRAPGARSLPRAAARAHRRHGADAPRRPMRSSADLLRTLAAVNRCPRCGAVDGSRRLSVLPALRCSRRRRRGGRGRGGAPTTRLPGPTWASSGLEDRSSIGAAAWGACSARATSASDRAVAVKVLRPESAADPDFRARFAREARTLARLEHPGIVAVHDFGTTADGDGYLVMQLVSGGSIAERLPLPVAEALAIARQLCDALTYAHGRGIIHRDIKPENVLIGDDGRARLSDFGIARLVDPDGPSDGPADPPVDGAGHARLHGARGARRRARPIRAWTSTRSARC